LRQIKPGSPVRKHTWWRTGIQIALKELNMKYAAFPIGLVAAVLAFSPASAHMQMCSDMSKMTSMMNGMPDSPKKWEMNRHLAMVNAAMAKDGTQGCKMAMMTMMQGKNMSMMKSGTSGRRKTGAVGSTHVH
jgi:hypothetical protein